MIDVEDVDDYVLHFAYICNETRPLNYPLKRAIKIQRLVRKQQMYISIDKITQRGRAGRNLVYFNPLCQNIVSRQ